MPADTQLRISLFGEPLVCYGDAPIPWSAPRRALSLLAYLVLQRRPVSREVVAFRLWPDLPEPDARANLRRHLLLLQAVLPKPAHAAWLLADRRTIHWRGGDDVWNDVCAFETLSTDIRTLAQAADLYTGDLAVGFDDEWLVTERERLRELQFRNLRALIEEARVAGVPRDALAHAGRMLTMDPWREDAVRSAIASRCEFGDRAGAVRFYREFEARLQAELGVEPMPETTAAYERARAAEGTPIVVRGKPADAALDLAPDQIAACLSNVPITLTTFVGREGEFDRLSHGVREQSLTTIWGPGGVGKTRLACEAARALQQGFADGARFIELDGAISDSDVLSTAASVLDARCAEGETVEEAIVAALRSKSLLLVLDNCEHVIEAAALLVGRILSTCPHVAIIATSREPLDVPGEVILPLPPLDVPARANDAVLLSDDVRASAAARLFVERARTNGVEIEPRRDDSALRTICRRLDGMPLALEIAARRSRVMTLAQIAAMLDGELQVLSGNARGGCERQRSLETVIGWSFGLLHERGRRVLRRLTVFRGTFDLDDAIAACSGANEDGLDILDEILGLVDKSMVVLVRGPTASRYRLLETIRTFVRARADVEEIDAAHHALARHYLRRIPEHPDGIPYHRRDPRQRWQSTVAPQFENIRGVLTWALRHENGAIGLELLERIRPYLAAAGLLAEATNWYELALGTPAGKLAFETDPLFVGGMANVTAIRGFPGEALPLHERAVALLRRADDPMRLMLALQRQAFTFDLAGDTERAEQIFREAHRIAEAEGDDFARGLIAYRLASIALDLEDDARALRLIDEADSVAQRYGDDNLAMRCIWERCRNPRWERSPEERIASLTEVASSWRNRGEYMLLANTLQELGRLLLEQGQAERAIASVSESLRVGVDTRRDVVGMALENCAQIAAGIGDWRCAGELLGAADALRARPATRRQVSFREAILAPVETNLGRLETPAALFAGGRRSLRDAIGVALHVLDAATAHNRGGSVLSGVSLHEHVGAST